MIRCNRLVLQMVVTFSLQSTRSEWCEVFLIAAELYLFGACIYIILADGKKQWWADGLIKHKHSTLLSSTEDCGAINS